MGDGEIARVRQRQQRAGRAHSGESIGGSIMKAQGRRAVTPYHLDALPVDTPRETGTQRLHRRFFCGKSRGERCAEVAFAPAVRDLLLGEDALHEMVTITIDRVDDAVDLGRVHSGPYNVHGSYSSYMSLPAVPDTFEWTRESWGD